MPRTRSILTLFLFGFQLTAQQTNQVSDRTVFEGATRVGPGVNPPHVRRKVDPEYTPEARANQVQGTVVCELVVTEKGRAAGVTVISPLGFGLDDAALAAIAKWDFSPGEKNGQPVKILATVEVNFRLSNRDFDEKLERQRTSFNLAVQTLRRPSSEPKIFDKAHQSMIDLANQGFPPAMNLVGHWEIAGDRMTKDPIGGLDLIRKAAGKNYGPALYEIAVREIEGRDIAADPPKGLDRMRRAAGLGSQAAQSYLGDLYDKGATVTRDADKAKRYFRLCAALGNSDCQFRLGTIILETPEHPERDTVQAMAWLQLAAENGNGAAGKVVSRESENLTSAQITLVNKLKSQLVRK